MDTKFDDAQTHNFASDASRTTVEPPRPSSTSSTPSGSPPPPRAPRYGVEGDCPMIGTSPVIVELRRRLERLASSHRPVLVLGPTGVGKEVAVRALHRMSERAREPLLSVNCGAIPDELMESELFGHERGAFTSADRRRDGYLTEAGRGTLFLDEVGELSPRLQAKLLRVLESGEYRPVGGPERHFEGRVVAATHVNLARRVSEGRFREDLYFRLHVLTVRVPTLAERSEDIPALVRHFVGAEQRHHRLDAAAMRALAAFPWPGNIRQLRSVVERLWLFCDGDVIRAEDVRRELDEESLGAVTRAEAPTGHDLAVIARQILASPVEHKLAEVERSLVEEALRITSGNKTEAARHLGVHRKVVERRTERSARDRRRARS